MNNLGNLSAEQQNTSLWDVPGAATIKACSILINSFLHYDAFSKGTDKKVKAIKDDLFNRSSDRTATAGSIASVEQPSAEVNASEPESQSIAKAHGMVQHLKHTHTSNSGS